MEDNYLLSLSARPQKKIDRKIFGGLLIAAVSLISVAVIPIVFESFRAKTSNSSLLLTLNIIFGFLELAALIFFLFGMIVFVKGLVGSIRVSQVGKKKLAVFVFGASLVGYLLVQLIFWIYQKILFSVTGSNLETWSPRTLTVVLSINIVGGILVIACMVGAIVGVVLGIMAWVEFMRSKSKNQQVR